MKRLLIPLLLACAAAFASGYWAGYKKGERVLKLQYEIWWAPDGTNMVAQPRQFQRIHKL